MPPGPYTGEPQSFEAFRLEDRDQLPIEEKAAEVLYSIEMHQTSIVIGETGSGKSTKLPQLLLATGRYQRRIGVTLPRRVSVVNVAKRLASNLGSDTVGGEVGYAIRFDRQVSERTKIKVLTDGTLLQEMLTDPLLKEYSLLMIDDCHERSMYTDMLLGLLKKIRRRRHEQNDELKIVISSATIDAQLYLDFFNEAPLFRAQVVQVHGRAYPVELFYLDQATKDYVAQAVATVKQVHLSETDPNSGSVLVFLTGKEEIEEFMRKFEAMITDLEPFKRNSLFCQACYGGMPLTEQVKIFEPAPFNTRKVIVATNVAETSITIDGVSFVVDACLTKVKAYDPTLNLEQLMVIPASQASCNQRAGRAGRTKPGKCYRLCTQSYFEENLPVQSQPEIERSDLTQMILQLKGLGIRNLLDFDYFDSGPSRQGIVQSLDLLYNLGAIDASGELTVDRGLTIADLAIDPRYATALLVANQDEYRVCNEVLTITALMQFSQQLFTNQADSITVSKVKKRPQHGVIEGDHVTLLNIFNNLYNGHKSQGQRNGMCRELRLNQWAWDKASEVRSSLKRQLSRLGIRIAQSDDYDDPQAILKALTIGFYANIAQRQFNGTYTNLANPLVNGLEIHPSSVLSNLKPKVVIYHELVVISATGRGSRQKFMTEVSQIELEWVFNLVPNSYYVDARKQIALKKHQNEVQAGTKRTFGASSLAQGATRFNKKGLNLTKSTNESAAIEQAADSSVATEPSKMLFKTPKQKFTIDKKPLASKKLVGLSFGGDEDEDY